MALQFFHLSYKHDFLSLSEVLRRKPRSPEVLGSAVQARLRHLARLAETVEQEGSVLPRDAMRLFAAEVRALAGEVETLLASRAETLGR